jgi:hypothetical protein
MWVGVAEAERQLSAIDVDKLAMSETLNADLRKNAPDFQFAYLALLAVIQPKVDDSMDPTIIPSAALANIPAHSDPSTPSNKRLSETTVDPSASKRPKSSSNQMPSSNPRTPDQSAVLPNPDYSGDSILSGASNESADEELSRRFLEAFVDATMACLENDFMQLRWSKSGPMRVGFG